MVVFFCFLVFFFRILSVWLGFIWFILLLVCLLGFCFVFCLWWGGLLGVVVAFCFRILGYWFFVLCFVCGCLRFFCFVVACVVLVWEVFLIGYMSVVAFDFNVVCFFRSLLVWVFFGGFLMFDLLVWCLVVFF